MFLLVVILTAACVYLEIKIMKRLPSWALDLLARFRLLSLGFSLALSVMLGHLFGAMGLIVFAAGVISTVVVQPFYALNKTGKWAEYEQRYAELKLRMVENKHLYVRRVHQTKVILGVCWNVLMIPFRVIFFIWDAIEYISIRLTRS